MRIFMNTKAAAHNDSIGCKYEQVRDALDYLNGKKYDGIITDDTSLIQRNETIIISDIQRVFTNSNIIKDLVKNKGIKIIDALTGLTLEYKDNDYNLYDTVREYGNKMLDDYINY